MFTNSLQILAFIATNKDHWARNQDHNVLSFIMWRNRFSTGGFFERNGKKLECFFRRPLEKEFRGISDKRVVPAVVRNRSAFLKYKYEIFFK